jgi:glycosyltransferase involved in cell wall biosynthesis
MMFDLSITLITYNRSSYLRRTLTALSDSVFKDCDLWILNNASTDDTLQVCNEFSALIPKLHVVTHRYNVGSGGNLLRAYEYGQRTYTWVLCDDDVLHLDHIGDLLDCLQRRECDLIRISDVGVIPEERGQLCTLEDLLHNPNSFSFYSFGFVPGIIFRQEAVGPHVRFGYIKAYTSYPQLFVLMRAFGPKSKVYTTAAVLLARGDASTGIGSEILLYQIYSLEALPTRRARAVAMGWRRKHQKLLGYIFGYGRLILADLRFGRPRRRIFSIWIKTIMATPSVMAKLILLLNGIFLLAPIRPIYRLVRGKRMEPRSYPDR